MASLESSKCQETEFPYENKKPSGFSKQPKGPIGLVGFLLCCLSSRNCFFFLFCFLTAMSRMDIDPVDLGTKEVKYELHVRGLDT